MSPARDSTTGVVLSQGKAAIYPPIEAGGSNFSYEIWSPQVGYSGIFYDQDPYHSDLDFTRKPDGTLVAKGSSWGNYADPQYPGNVPGLQGRNIVREDFVYSQKAGSSICDMDVTITEIYDVTRMGFVYQHFKGQTLASGTCVIALGDQNANQHPTVSLTAPAAGASFSAPATIALTATAADSDGTIAKVEFFNGGVSLGLGTFSNGAYTLNWTGVAAKSYSITAVATDNQGAASTSEPLTVTVSAARAPYLYVKSDAANGGDGTSWSKALQKIGDAISLAKSGDEIWVAAGTYAEASSQPTVGLMLADNVALYGGFIGSETERDQRDWNKNKTTIQTGAALNGIVYISNDGVSAATVDGFTITNDGGSNAFALAGTGGLRVVNNVIQATSNKSFGAVECISYTKSSSADSVVIGNRISGFVYAVYMKGFATHVTIANNVFSKNYAGIFDFNSTSSVNIVNNTIVDGSAVGISRRDAKYSLYNNIVAYTSGPGLSLVGAGLGGNSGSVIGSDNLSYHNRKSGEALDTNTDYALPGDSHADPQFVDSNSNFQLQPTSPAVGSGEDDQVIGTTDAEGNPRSYNQVDLGGLELQPSGPTVAVPQIQPASGLYFDGVSATLSCATPNAQIHYTLDGNIPTTESPLYTGSVPVAVTALLKAKAFADGYNSSGVASASYTVPLKVRVKADAPGPTHDGRSWSTAFNTIGSAIAQYPDNAQLWIAAGTYSESLTLHGNLFLYGGFAGNEANLAQRDIRRNVTTIATGNSAAGITYTPSSADKQAVVDGFTITNTLHSTSATGMPPYLISARGGLMVSNNIMQAAGGVVGVLMVDWPPIIPAVDLVISGNQISVMSAGVSGYFFTGHATVANNVIFSSGLGISDSQSTSGTLLIVNNTLVHNYTAGVLRLYSNFHLFNNIAAFNTQYGLAVRGQVGTRTIDGSTNDAYGNGTDRNQALTDDLSVDPKFVNDAAEFHLQSVSPMINRGDNAQVVGATDADNNPRRYNNATVDLGAHEYQGDANSINQPPTVALTSPANNSSFTLPATVTLSATASDPGGSISKVEFFQGTTLICSGTFANNSYSCSWSPTQAGSYSLKAKATDNLGATTTSTPVPVTVIAGGGARRWYVTWDAPANGDGTSWPTAFQTITAAVNAAQSGDTVWVSAAPLNGPRGRFGLTTITTKSLSIYGGFTVGDTQLSQRNPTTNVTSVTAFAINGDPQNIAGTQMLIDGFTLVLGANSRTISCTGATLELAHLVFNHAGTGVYSTSCNANIHHNSFPPGNDNAIWIFGPQSIVSDNSFIGTGLAVEVGPGNASATISNNVFATVKAAVALRGTAQATIVNNTLVNSTGFGVSVAATASASLINNLIVRNVTGIQVGSGATVTLSHNDVFGNVGGNYSGVAAGASDISIDPQFANAVTDFHLTANSSGVVDAGDDSVYHSGDLDLEGNPRLFGPHIGLGAYEYQGNANNQSPTIAQAASASPMRVTAKTTNLAVLGADANDGEAALTYTWSGPAEVSFRDNNSNDAKNTLATFSTAGTFTLTVTVRDPAGATVTSAVTVTVVQTLTTITLTAPSNVVHPGGQEQFTATQLDQFNHPMDIALALVWQTPSPNTIDQTGLFTAGQSVGTTSVAAVATVIPGQLTVVGGIGVIITAATPPTITWIAPSNNATFPSETAISLEVNAQAYAGAQVVSVEFFADARSLGTATQAPYTFVWNGASIGAHTLTARVTDSGGLMTTSSALTLIVTVPAGTVQSVSPQAVSEDDPAPLLTIGGFGFTSDTQLLWDGRVRATTPVDDSHRTLQLSADDLSQAQIHTLSLVGGNGSTTFEVVPVVSGLRFDDLPSRVSRTATIKASGANASSYVFEFIPQNSLTDGAGVASISRAGGFSAASLSGVLSLASVNQLVPGQRYHVQVTAANRLGKISSPVDADIVIIGDDYSALRVFPNPYRTDRDTGGKITFDRMTPNSTVKLFTISGQFVKVLDGSSGLATWDLTTDGGDAAASGIYLYLVTNPQGQKAKGKLAVLR